MSCEAWVLALAWRFALRGVEKVVMREVGQVVSSTSLFWRSDRQDNGGAEWYAMPLLCHV